ncbi:MAG TPA: hypothetical protein PKO06_08650, partial [Candidatus Ozemobacteraceae bacterium]|nr:hypothetical protein [Candidatus Ozemobacteraceae bacterium]
MTASGNRTPILAHLPDLLLTVAFLGLTLATLLDTGGAAALAQELGYWLVYEFVGLFFLMFWAGLNEGRGDHPLDERFRVISTCAIYAASGLLMHALWAIPSSIVLVSSAGGIWALVNPFLREDRPTPFRQGQETALAFVSLL